MKLFGTLMLILLVALACERRGVAQELKLADSPVSVASFGAAVCDGYLYLLGGNEGTAHGFSMEGQNDVFRRLKLHSSATWEELGKLPRRQGNALVTYDGKLYHLGGFEARNVQGDDQDLHSSDDFRCYDPKTKKWSDLPALPETRSSFDAVVVDGVIYVVGGWSLRGKDEESVWHPTAWKFDLKKEGGKWEALAEPPVVRRANSVSHRDGKIYVIGGMKERGGPTTEVAVYDPATNEWSEGPALPGGPMEGFGNSSFNVGGRLVVSTVSGLIQQLSDDGKSWEKLQQLEEGRFFHRMVALDDQRVALLCGATQQSGKTGSVLVVDLGEAGSASK